MLTYGERAWHYLDENHKRPLVKADLANLFFPYRTGQATVEIDGVHTKLDGWKSIVADMRGISDVPFDFRPVHVARDSYEIIQNEAIFDAFLTALDGIPHEIVSAGSLGGLCYFFASARLLENDTIKMPDGSECKAFFSLFSSHNGTKNATYYDTTHRTVCMNTVRSSLAASGNAGFNIGHTSGATVRIANMAQVVNDAFKGRDKFAEIMADLYATDCTTEFAEKFTTGYVAQKAGNKDKPLATRGFNQVSEILRLSTDGKGNEGNRKNPNLFYLAQGATDYWTRGDGTGKGRDTGKKAFSSEFGGGMDNKIQFIQALAEPKKRAELVSLGDKILSLSA